MSWQDLSFALGGLMFTVALKPAVTGRMKPPAETCLMTAVWLTWFLVVYWSLHLWLSLAVTSLSALTWWVLFVQVRFGWLVDGWFFTVEQS